NNTYAGLTTVTSGFLQVAGSMALGAANPAEGLGTVVNSGAVLELNNATLTNEHLQLNNGIGANQLGLYDVPGLFTVAQPAGVNTMFGTGILRALGGGASTINGNVDLRGDGT